MAELTISTDKARLDIQLIHNYLSEQSYWAKNIPLVTVERSIEHSVCFGVYLADKQIGFARVISDCATFAYLCDVFVLPGYREKGVAKKLMEFIKEHPGLQGLRRWMLATLDAHSLYQQFGFTDIAKPERLMEISTTSIYSALNSD